MLYATLIVIYFSSSADSGNKNILYSVQNVNELDDSDHVCILAFGMLPDILVSN